MKGLHERLGDAIAFRTFDRREAGFEVHCDHDVERLGGRIDRAVVWEPLDRMECTNRPEAAPDALDHEVTDHLAGDACGGSDPADDLAVMAVECEGGAHDLAVPAGELQTVRAQADVGPQCDDAAVVPPLVVGVRYGARAAGHASSSAGKLALH